MNIIIFIGYMFVTFCISVCYKIGEGKSSISYFDRNYTTIAKGIAIIMIMLHHCVGTWDGGRLLTPCGGIGVSIFLLASGYGLNESYKRNGLKNFWKKRLGRVYIPYLVAIIIFAIVKKWDIEDCLWNLSCIHSPYWFVTYIVECYIIYWFTSKFIPRYRNTVILLISLVVLVFLPNLQAEQSLGFITGIWLSTHKEKLLKFRENKKSYMLACITLAFVGILFLAIKQLPIVRNGANEIEMNIIQCLIKYPLSLFILLAIDYSKKILTNPFLHLSGLISYELYLVHYPFYGMIGNRLWAALALLSVSYILAYLFYKMDNRIHKLIIQ